MERQPQCFSDVDRWCGADKGSWLIRLRRAALGNASALQGYGGQGSCGPDTATAPSFKLA